MGKKNILTKDWGFGKGNEGTKDVQIGAGKMCGCKGIWFSSGVEILPESLHTNNKG